MRSLIVLTLFSLLKALWFLHDNFGLVDMEQLLVTVVGECIVQILLDDKEFGSEIRQVTTLLEDHPLRFLVDHLRHEIFLAGNSFVRERAADHFMELLSLRFDRASSFLQALQPLMDKLGAVGWEDQVVPSLVSQILERIVRSLLHERLQPTVAAAFRSLLEIVRIRRTGVARDKMHSRMRTALAKPIVWRNLVLSQRPFQQVLSRRISEEWPRLRAVLDQMHLLTGRSLNDPLLAPLLWHHSRSRGRGRTGRDRSMSTPLIQFGVIMNLSGVHGKQHHSKHPQLESVLETSAVELRALAVVLGKMSSLVPVGEGPFNRMAELLEKLQTIHIECIAELEAPESRSRSFDATLVRLGARSCPIYLEYASTLHSALGIIMESLAHMPSLRSFVERLTCDTPLGTCCVAQVVMWPLERVLTKLMETVPPTSDARRLLSTCLLECDIDRFQVLQLEEKFSHMCDIFTEPRELKARVHLWHVSIQKFSMSARPVVCFLLSGNAVIVCHSTHATTGPSLEGLVPLRLCNGNVSIIEIPDSKCVTKFCAVFSKGPFPRCRPQLCFLLSCTT